MYKDRGIMKWAPFDAMVGFKEDVENMKEERERRERPVLTQDILDEFNISIADAIRANNLVEIMYYSNGYINNVIGIIKEVDMYNKIIIFDSDYRVKITDVVDVITHI